MTEARSESDPKTSAQHGIRTRVWRNGNLEAEDFPFEEISDYLAQEDCRRAS